MESARLRNNEGEKMKGKRTNWLVGVCNTEGDGVFLSRVNGTEKQIKRYLLKLLNSDRRENSDEFDYGTTSEEEIESHGEGFYAYAVYSTYHIDYNAIKEREPLTLH